MGQGDWNGDIKSSYVYRRMKQILLPNMVLIDNGFVIFNDMDAQGDEEVGDENYKWK